jgi:hypothetical protein
MNTWKITFVVFFISILVYGCSKENSSPEPYSSYISMKINSGTNLGFRSDSIIQIYLRNDSDKDFEKECTISYLLNNPATGSNYTAENSIFNTQHPELPTGQLKLLRRDAQFFNINLSEISWNNHTISQLPSGQYSINIQLFIKDPYSPMNIVNSNEMIIDIK